jgi:hypothetical protein
VSHKKAHPPSRTAATRTIHSIGERLAEDAGGVMAAIMAGDGLKALG